MINDLHRSAFESGPFFMDVTTAVLNNVTALNMKFEYSWPQRKNAIKCALYLYETKCVRARS